MFVVGILLIMTGIKAIKTKRLRGKYGRIFEGGTAQILGGLYIVLGLALPVFAIAIRF